MIMTAERTPHLKMIDDSLNMILEHLLHKEGIKISNLKIKITYGSQY